MTYVVTESCIKCKYTDCVDACPVDAFREGPNFLVIDPGECIDCTLCVAECPVGAIFSEEDVPEGQRAFIALNAELSRHWKPIVMTKPPLPDADAWAEVKDKKDLLERSYAQEPALSGPTSNAHDSECPPDCAGMRPAKVAVDVDEPPSRP